MNNQKQQQALRAIWKQMRENMDEDAMWAMIERAIKRFKLDRIDAAAVRAEFN